MRTPLILASRRLVNASTSLWIQEIVRLLQSQGVPEPASVALFAGPRDLPALSVTQAQNNALPPDIRQFIIKVIFPSTGEALSETWHMRKVEGSNEWILELLEIENVEKIQYVRRDYVHLCEQLSHHFDDITLFVEWINKRYKIHVVRPDGANWEITWKAGEVQY